MSKTKTWPPPWTLKPTEGEPEDATFVDEGMNVGWDLSFGCRLNVGGDGPESDGPLVICANFSDADLARGFVKREVTPAQLVKFASLLLQVAVARQAGEEAKP